MEKQQLRRYILGVKLTPEQQVQFENGEAVYLENMRRKDGVLFSSYVCKDEEGRLNFFRANPKEIERIKHLPFLSSYGGVPLTPTQQINYRDGKTIFIQGAKKENENIERDIFVTRLPNGDDKIVPKNKKINLDELRKISIWNYLSSLGCKPQKLTGKDLWYKSPLRDEKTPSFKVDTERNTFKDFGGEGHGGSIIDLAMYLHNIDVKEAIKTLSEQTNLSVVSLSSATLRKEKEPAKIIVTHVDELKNPALLDYLEERCICPIAAKTLCQEVRYKVDGNDKEFLAIGFQNDSGGWELRNKYFKGCTSKDITCIENTAYDGGYRSIRIFEGFMDALSWYSVHGKALPSHIDIIVLNSTALLNEKNTSLIEILEKSNYVDAYFDNDATGKKCTEKLAKICKERGIGFSDRSSMYATYNDYNDYAVADQQKQQKQQKQHKPKPGYLNGQPITCKNTKKVIGYVQIPIGLPTIRKPNKGMKM